ncbi:MAG TPA: glycine--tRNA ligase subunit beta [Candidatus Obscuribacterales bacterium]
MPDYLLEIGCEELPADHVPEAQERLKSLLSDALAESNLNFEEMIALGTPRRLACIVKGLTGVQPTTQKKVKGPPLKAGFDQAGNPLPPAIGFAQKVGVKVDALDREEIGGVVYLVANLTVPGRPAADVLSELIPRVIEQISGERLMRWGSSDLKFSRPIRWLVSLLDEQEVIVNLDGIRSGRRSYGHRILAPGAVNIENPGRYVDVMRSACVLADPQERRDLIERAVARTAEGVSGRPRQLTGPLLQEVVNITEWPCAVLGEFAKEYLDLPDKLIETVMVHHQRYFPVEDKTGKGGLLPFFVSISNNDRSQAAPVIRKGNERVLRARLADGRFFYFDDQKVKLAERRSALAQLTFHEGVGSYLDKQERLVEAARAIARHLGLDARLAVCLERTMELCKVDLVTNLVRELPELQGYVGSWYASNEGEPPDVVQAIASHYSPRSTEDEIPGDTVGQLAAVLDKLDNLVAVFSMGKRPSGSSDPYVLRRQAQGVVDILTDGLSGYCLNVTDMIERFQEWLSPWFKDEKRRASAQKGAADLRDFILQRLRGKLLERGFRRETVEAVLSCRDGLADVPDVLVRCQVIDELIDSPGGLDLVRAGVRVGNILTPASPERVDSTLFRDKSERDLWENFNSGVVSVWQSDGRFRVPAGKDEYRRLLELLRVVAPHVHALFDAVMINDPDEQLKDNRHGLLLNVDRYFKAVADFPKLQPLLP